MAATHILAVGKLSKGHNRLVVAPHDATTAAELTSYLEQDSCKPLQDLIDYCAEAQELEDDIADRLFWARGEW